MATYATDLTTMVDFDGTPTSPTVAEAAAPWSAGRSPEEADTDFPIQSSTHASLTMNTTGKAGIMATNVSSFTWASGDYIFGWIIWLAPGAIATRASGGLAMIVGDSVANCEVFYVGGSDYGSYPYGGWQNFVVDPELTSQETLGTAPSDFDFVGAGANVLSQVSKGNPLGFDVFRYGRGEFQVSGTGSTFSGMAAANDASAARWGLFQEIAGSYLWKGLMSLGLTGTAVTFTDSNKSIVIDGVPLHVNSTFNAIEVNHASSVINWTNINITSLNTVSPGTFEMVADATVNMDTCVFTGMSTFVFDSNATIDNSTFRRCALVTQNEAGFDGCVFDSPSGGIGLLADDIDVVTNCDFTKGTGTNSAIELTSAHAAGSFTLDGCTFNGYNASNGQTDSCIYNNSGGHVNINITNSLDTPTYINGSGATTTITNNTQVTLTGLVNDSEVRVFLAAAIPTSLSITFDSGTTWIIASTAADMPNLQVNDVFMLFDREGSLNTDNVGEWTVTAVNTAAQSFDAQKTTGTPTAQSGLTTVEVNPTDELDGEESVTTGSWSFSLAAGTHIDYFIISDIYQNINIFDYTIPASNTSLPIQQIYDRNYSNPD